MTLRPATKTYAELALNVKRIFGDESGVQLSDTDLLRWANEAQTEIANNNKALKAKSTAASVAGQAGYTFPTERILQVESIHYNNRMIPNMPFASAEAKLFELDPDRTQQGTPELWYEWGGEFTLWPKPDVVGSITIYFTAAPPVLTGAPGELLGLPDKFYNAIVQYVLSQAYAMDEDFNASQLAESRFKAAIDPTAEEERQAANMTYPVIQEVW